MRALRATLVLMFVSLIVGVSATPAWALALPPPCAQTTTASFGQTPKPVDVSGVMVSDGSS